MPVVRSYIDDIVIYLGRSTNGMPVVRSYIDDIVIYSDRWQDHLRTLKEMFDKLRRARITAQPTK